MLKFQQILQQELEVIQDFLISLFYIALFLDYENLQHYIHDKIIQFF
ncbi:hypothetical protein pb186bvf_017898 [Paramecium bursaria]